MRVQDLHRYLTNRWVLFTIAVWLTVLAIFFANGSVYLGKTTTRSEIDQMQQDIKSLTEKKGILAQNKIELDLEDKKLSLILTDLLEACKESGTRLGETKVADLVDKENYALLPITVTVNGNYNQIGKFVNLLEKNMRFQVVEVSLSTRETESHFIACKISAEYVSL